MLQEIQVKWRRWREKRRQYQIELALYKMNGGATEAMEQIRKISMATGDGTLPRIEPPEGKAPDPRAAHDDD